MFLLFLNDFVNSSKSKLILYQFFLQSYMIFIQYLVDEHYCLVDEYFLLILCYIRVTIMTKEKQAINAYKLHEAQLCCSLLAIYETIGCVEYYVKCKIEPRTLFML